MTSIFKKKMKRKESFGIVLKNGKKRLAKLNGVNKKDNFMQSMMKT